MKNSIKQELSAYVTDRVEEMRRYKELPSDISDLHHELFNQDYYIIGYYQAEKWLEEHNISAWEGMSICQEYEIDNFGEASKKYDNAETTVNMLAYIYGEQLLHEMKLELN